MADLNKILVYRLIHIDNIPHVLRFGITHPSSPKSNSEYTAIGDSTLISTRSSHLLRSGKCLGDYIPFYFGTRMPMLYVIQHGYNMVTLTPTEKIIYVVSSVEKIISTNPEIIFTDGHAVDILSFQYSAKDLYKIDEIIDKKAIRSKYWRAENDLDLKRRKEAEFLVFGDIPKEVIIEFVGYNENVKKKLISFGIESSIIKVRPEYYF